ncbi:MAG: lactonase family protein [Verrucomicrobia bacterium]|nr:lactonase family protein [Verrucomicrobiota bacterium]
MKKTNFMATAFVLIFIILITAYGGTKGQAAVDKYQVYFGGGATGDQEGIFTSVLDMKTGQLTEAKLAGEAKQPGIITIHPAGTHLYSVGHPAGYTGPRSGSVCAFKINPATGALKLLNSQSSQGKGASYLILDPKGRNILICHYFSGNCAVLPLAQDGSLKPASSVQQHTGSSVNPTRQTAPHPHSIILDSAGRYAFVADLGLDQVLIYKFDSTKGTLTPNDPPFVAVTPGAAPRHFVFHPSEKFAYTNLELTSEVTAFHYDSARGALTEFQTVSTLPKDFAGRNANAGICVTPDGRFLYVSNRGHNSIAQFAVDSNSGTLALLGNESTRGDVPQTIAIDPTGSYLLVTDKQSDHISVFKIDKETGGLAYTGSNINVPTAGSIQFRPIIPL